MPASRYEAAIPREDDSFAPLVALENAIRFWWFVFLLAVVGGAAGWLMHLTQPPVYEAVARFSASIDYVRTGPLTQYEEDTAYNAIGNRIRAKDVLDAVVKKAAAQGIKTTAAELKASAVLERKFDNWDLRVRSADPQMAQRIANLWAEQAQASILTSYQHAVRADAMDHYLQSLEGCLAETAASEPSSSLCSRYRFADIQSDLRQAGDELTKERAASHGLFVGLTLTGMEPAATPGSPVLYDRNQLVLAGSLVGFLLGIWLVQLHVPEKLLSRSRRV